MVTHAEKKCTNCRYLVLASSYASQDYVCSQGIYSSPQPLHCWEEKPESWMCFVFQQG